MKTDRRIHQLGLFALFLFLFTGFAVPDAFSGQAGRTMPEEIDPSARYLIFLHNYYVEKNGVDGDCKYQKILNAFAAGGFIVISEVRTGKIIPCTYGDGVAKQVHTLLDSGVPPRNIVISGHSKGGVIALCTAVALKNPEINYVIMAGCGIAGIKKYNMYPDFSGLQGKVLSVYAGSDAVAGSCGPDFSKASKGLVATELKLESEAGHRLFFAPHDIWMAPVVDWINKNQR